MWKLISITIGIIISAIFFIQNMDKVHVRFIISDPVDIRLTYLLLTSFVLGYLFCTFLNLIRNIKKRERNSYEGDMEFEEE